MRSREATYTMLVKLANARVGDSWRQYPSAVKVSLIAAASEIAVEEYFRLHTLLPFGSAWRSTQRIALSWRATTGSPGKASLFGCPRCNAEAKERLGHAIVQTVHQIVGVDWCVKHQEPLFECDGLARPLVATVPKRAPLFAASDVEVMSLVTPLMHRYAEIAVGILGRGRVANTNAFFRRIVDKAVAAGLESRRIAKKQTRLLSDAVRDQCHPAWLDSIFPGILATPRDMGFKRLDDALRVKSESGEPHVLTLAYLFDSAQQALSAFDEMVADQNASPELVNHLDDPLFFRTYVECDGHLNRTLRTLSLEHYPNAIRAIPSLSGPTGRAIEAVLVQGQSVDEAGKTFGVRSERIQYMLCRGGSRLQDAIHLIRAKSHSASRQAAAAS